MKTDSCRSGSWFSALSLQKSWDEKEESDRMNVVQMTNHFTLCCGALLSVIDLCVLIIELTVRCWQLNVCFGIYVYLLFIFKTWRWADWTFLASSWVRMKHLFVSSTLLRNTTEHCTDIYEEGHRLLSFMKPFYRSRSQLWCFALKKIYILHFTFMFFMLWI